MEALALYLLKSVVWLAGFTLVFILFLKNERFFLLNRIFLLAGILTSFLFPLISIHYTVVLPVFRNMQNGSAIISEIQNTGNSIIPDLKILLLILYVSGVLFMLALIIRQGRSVLRAIRRSEIIAVHPVKLIKTTDYTSAFSFFSYVFVNPSITDIETKEIMNHELVHIGQKHWVDLVLVELLCMMQWFNPFVWIYVRFIRQNHEYLADEVALQRTSDPAIYRAALLNQIVGATVVNLANSFNYSLNKKRFIMMKNIKSSPYRKMKVLFILPVFAIVFYSFAKPDYKYINADERSGNNYQVSSIQTKGVKGTVKELDGKALKGVAVVLKGTNIGISTDADGNFKLDNVPDDGILVVSFVGYKSKELKPVFTSEMTISMMRDTTKYFKSEIGGTPPPPPPPPPLPDNVSNININVAPPPPPPPPVAIKFKGDGPPPLWVVDGITKTQAEAENIDPNAIESVNVLKDKSSTVKPATDKYGVKGKDGVIEITTKKFALQGNENKIANLKITEYGSRDTVKVVAYGGVQFRRADGSVASPLVVVDGVILNIDVNKIDPETIESITVLKEGLAIDKYGEKAKGGVIEITTKKNVVAPLKVLQED